MKLCSLLCICLTISLLFPVAAHGNSAPVVIREDPAFTVAPLGETAISVREEYLKFDLSRDGGDTANVAASYIMANESEETIRQAMLFPFITAPYKGFAKSVSITADGIPLDFQVFRLRDIPFDEYMSYNETFPNDKLRGELAIDSIISLLAASDYQPENFDLRQAVRVYTIHLPTAEEFYEAQVNVQIDPQKDRLLTYNINGLSYYSDGKAGLTISMPPYTATPQKASFVILGETFAANVVSPSGHDITVEEKTLQEYLQQDVVGDSLLRYEVDNREELTAYTIKQLDTMLGKMNTVINLDEEVIISYLHSTYLGAFLFSADFDPETSINVMVEYEMRATRDRSETREHTSKFLYLLQPASAWASFGDLHITVIPHDRYPFIIDSSLPLQKEDATGYYSGAFSGLPQEDFYFVTYKTDQPDPPVASDSLRYILAMLTPALLIFGGMLVTAIIIVSLLRKKQLDL